MANEKKRECYVSVLVCDRVSYQVLHHAVIFVLGSAVVCVQEHVPLPKTVMQKEIVEPTDHNVGTFAIVSCLICQEIDLARQSFARYTKYCALPRRKEVVGARLKWIGGIAYLLCMVKREVDLHIPGVAGGS